MSGSASFDRWRLIVFDFDGTLVDSQHNIVRIMQHAFDSAGLDAPTPDAVRRTVGLTLGTAVETLLGEELVERAVEVAEHYRKEATAYRSGPDFHEPLYPGARETVLALDRPEMRLGIATGKHMRGLSFSLDHHGLRPHFVTLQTADRGPGKPDPFMLTEAMAEAGCASEETVMIGDTIHVRLDIVDTKAMPRLGGGSVTMKVTVYNQDEQVVNRGHWVMLVESQSQEEG